MQLINLCLVCDAHGSARYRLAADNGDADAQCNLGVCYANGIGVAKDEHEAVRCYQRAADQLHDGALYNLGVCYATGNGIDKDEAVALRLYHLAADHGHADAQHNLGVCYANGVGVDKDELESVRWYQLAADQGHTLAQCVSAFPFQSLFFAPSSSLLCPIISLSLKMSQGNILTLVQYLLRCNTRVIVIIASSSPI